MRRVAAEWGLRLMKNKIPQKWYIINEHWIENTEEYRVKQRVILTNNLKKYCVVEKDGSYYLKNNMYCENVYSFVKEWCVDTMSCLFTVESKNGSFRCVGNLNRCFAFVNLMKDELKWKDWIWTNQKFGKVDYIEITKNVDQEEEF